MDKITGRFFRLGMIAASVIFLLDQLSKWLVLRWAGESAAVQSQEALPFFNLVLVWNHGISFGMFSNPETASPVILMLVAGIITLVMTVLLWKAQTRFPALAMGLVIGGAVGNIIDRARFGAVVDFLDFHLAGMHWPAFNIADSAICIGVTFLIWDSFFGKSHEISSQ